MRKRLVVIFFVAALLAVLTLSIQFWRAQKRVLDLEWKLGLRTLAEEIRKAHHEAVPRPHPHQSR